MTDQDDDKQNLENAWGESAKEADALLAKELEALRKATRPQLAALVPDTTDPKVRDQLIDAVQAATQKNEDLAALETRLQQCGPAAVALAKTVAKLLIT
jgi:hypothetical protein